MVYFINPKILFVAPMAGRLKSYSPCILIIRTLVELPINWKRPTKVPWYDARQTGDGVLKLEVDMSGIPSLVEKSKEIENVDENVKKLFTFHFMGRKYAMKRVQEEIMNSVKGHKYDSNSLEVKIAAQTAVVRNLMEHFHNDPYDKKSKVYLKELIERRNKRLGDLRKFDYKKFEWILDKLDLYYRPKPEVLDKVERKKSIRYLTQRYCDEFKEKKREEYRQILESQKLNFLQNKISTLEWVRKEELECGITPTVTDDDIGKAKQQLENHMKSLETLEKKMEDNILTEM